jgi:hypothetical protein
MDFFICGRETFEVSLGTRLAVFPAELANKNLVC